MPGRITRKLNTLSMKTKLVSLLIVVGVLMPAAAFADMPNFVGSGYKRGADCIVPPDRGVWEEVGGKITLVYCWTELAWNKAAADSATRTYKFGVGNTVFLKNGKSETCPFFFVPSAGCVIDPAIVR